MTWPTTLANTFTGNSSASVSSARAEIDATIVAVNGIIASKGVASGVAALTATGVIQANNLPATYTTTSQDLTLQPSTSRTRIDNIINLEPQTVAAVSNIASPATGDVVYVSNGDTGDPCIGVYTGTAWKVVGFGANIAAS